MWRYVTNCFRENFQRAPGRYGQATRPSSYPSQAPTPAPASQQRPTSGDNEHRTNKDDSGWYQKQLCDSWISAFTWSSALILGWYTSQIACLRQRHYGWKENLWKKYGCENFLLKNTHQIHSIVLSHVAFAQPTTKKTLSYSTPIYLNNLSDITNSTIPLNVSNDVIDGNNSSTKEENEFRDVLRSIENKLGIAAIQDGNTQEGLEMLQSSAQKDHVPAIFNLAVCYEKGVGIQKDEKMAMELYRAAATKSHSGALYNLAIFYGQGRGGLTRDTAMAEDLLRAAAAKGQKEAIAAISAFKSKETMINEDHDNVSYKIAKENEPTGSFLKLIGCVPNPIVLY